MSWGYKDTSKELFSIRACAIDSGFSVLVSRRAAEGFGKLETRMESRNKPESEGAPMDGVGSTLFLARNTEIS